MEGTEAMADNPWVAFERSVRRHAARVAVVDDDMQWTYQQLQEDVERRALALERAGVRPGQRVALVAESSAYFLSTALAVWRRGAVLVTIYPSSGPEDLAHALESSDPALIVCGPTIDTALVSGLAPEVPMSDVEIFAPVAVRGDTEPNPSDVREALQLICFSSGTTSRPKAIMLGGQTLVNCALTYAEVWHLGPEDRGVVCLPMAWLYGLASTSLALLLSGGTVVVVRRARPEPLLDAVIRSDATFLAGVTANFAKLVRHLEDEGIRLPPSSSLRLCISGGEPRNEGIFGRWADLTGVAVLDAYCASECLPLVTYDPTVDRAPRPGSAGKLVPRALLRIVDQDGHDVPAGEVGEGLSSGPGLMLGYWREPELTAEALTDDGWYRTKDLLRIDEEGYVYVVGRLSDMIIRGGVNVSPAEVEATIRTCDHVEDVAVVGLPDDIYGQRVVAAVVGRPHLDLTVLREQVQARLSGYKVPSTFVAVDGLPVNATTGKTNRRAVAELLASIAPDTLATR
ncbi:class I adenylate-forming enzyme family protein [Nocardioides sp. AN3]